MKLKGKVISGILLTTILLTGCSEEIEKGLENVNTEDINIDENISTVIDDLKGNYEEQFIDGTNQTVQSLTDSLQALSDVNLSEEASTLLTETSLLVISNMLDTYTSLLTDELSTKYADTISAIEEAKASVENVDTQLKESIDAANTNAQEELQTLIDSTVEQLNSVSETLEKESKQ
ncbi:hypothetical protein [Bacillus sp. B1-b2]|uniref:hypothetical protein n=1 Tax=Bacillus sp. B1-b2 TaxID=2653201 RepID=UPI0012622953|nr:hypothetical protein [Bacillus sp. B1-b2]KAB7672008.1 hypothetical protein F9279_03540 [Bacillus sp. B1-b2]